MKYPHKDSGCFRPLSIPSGETRGADPIDEEADDNTTASGLSEHLKEPLTRLVRRKDVELHINAHRRPIDRCRKRLKEAIAIVNHLTSSPRRR
jgi:hypothetical protein